MKDSVYYLRNGQIDFAKWDNCIAGSENGLIYGMSYYLNNMCSQWDALVLNDYEAVMPLPYRKKWGIYYLYQPFVTAQLGLFSTANTAALLHLFLTNIPAHFRYWDITLNYKNCFPSHSFPLFFRSNFILSLNASYTTIRSGYKQTTKRNLKKSTVAVAYINKEVPVEKIIALNRALHKEKKQKVSEKDYSNFHKLFQHLKAENKAIAYGAFSDKDHLLSSAVFFLHQQRAYYILPGNTVQSKTTGASHRLIDAFIQDHAGQDIVLDFEGSDVATVAFFYRSFGATEEKYAALRFNKLPLFIKWIKS